METATTLATTARAKLDTTRKARDLDQATKTASDTAIVVSRFESVQEVPLHPLSALLCLFQKGLRGLKKVPRRGGGGG